MSGESSSDEDLVDLPVHSPRASRYRRSGTPEVVEAVKLIKHKVKWGWSDRRIARRLVTLTGQPWTARQVRYWRQVEGIQHASAWKNELKDPVEMHGFRRRVYASRRGWNHLLTDAGGDHRLDPTPRQVDILTILAEYGPCTAREIILHLRIPIKRCRHPLKASHNTHTAILIQRGWVVRAGRKEVRGGVHHVLFTLAPGIERHLPSDRPTSIDLYEQSLENPSAE